MLPYSSSSYSSYILRTYLTTLSQGSHLSQVLVRQALIVPCKSCIHSSIHELLESTCHRSRVQNKQKPACKAQPHLRKVCEDPHEVNSPSELSPFHEIMFQIKHFVTSHHIISYDFFYIDISHDFNYLISCNPAWQNH